MSLLIQNEWPTKNIAVLYILNENQHKVIETVPGWLHTIKNIGMKTAYGIIWANEEFKINNSDTYYIYE